MEGREPGKKGGEAIWGPEDTRENVKYLLSGSDKESTKDDLLEEQEHGDRCSD